MFRSALAFIVAAFPVAFFQAVVVALWPKGASGIFSHPASMFVAMCLTFYIVGLVLGLPLLLFLRKRRAPTLRGYVFGGAAIMLVPIAIGLGFTVFHGQFSAYTMIYDVALFGLGGAMAGAIFYALSTTKGSIGSV